MASKAKRDKVMFTFVCTEKKEFQENAVDIAKNILLRKIFRTPHDLVQFCKWTNTLLPCYEDFMEVKEESLINLNKFIIEGQVYSQESKESDWIKALHTSIKYATEVMKTSTISCNSFQVILFTSLENAAAKESIIDKCIQNLQEKSRIRCYILGPKLEIPLEFKSVDSIPEILTHDKSLIQQYGNNANSLLRFVNETNSLTCGLEVGQHLIAAYKPVFKNPQAWKTNLTIGDRIVIPVVGFRYSQTATTPKLSGIEEEVFPLFETANKKSEPVDQSDESSDEDSTEVYLTRVEVAAHKMQTERCVDLLFVIDASEINEIYSMGSHAMYFLFGQQSHCRVFSTLVDVLHETNSVAIARKCYNKGNYPKLIALIPRQDLRKNCLQMMELPYFENMSDPLQFIDSKTNLWNMTSAIENKYPELEEPIFNYLNVLCIEENESLIDKKTYLHPHLQHNPEWDAFYNTYLERKKDPKCQLEPQVQITNFFEHVSSQANAVEVARQQIFG